ncbi:MAG: hypothetical protein MSC31_09560 [Solirubrobacteraceae bacterium MAG38_C4-C5]|nr:hypothetical protein [Candidatus Siliceabacter maunaloa]
MARRSLLSSTIAALLVAGLCAAPAPALGAPPVETLAGSAGQGPALDVAQTPTGLAVSDGRLFVADETFAVVRVLDPATGAQTVVAGNASKGREGDGGPATAAQLGGSSSGIGPQGIALTPEGDLLIADTGSNRVRRVDAGTGEISTVAGTGTFGSAVDGGPATEADLGAPYGVAALPDGGFVVADTSNHRIRRVAPDGTISTVAGSRFGFAGDGGPADAAQLALPRGVAVAADGDLFIADTSNNAVRRVDARDGTIATVAGRGTADPAAGGPATGARLNVPVAVALDEAGDLFVVERGGHRVSRVAAADGTIEVVAGTGTGGFSGDGGPADQAQLLAPAGLALDGGRLFIADGFNRRVRAVDLADGLIDSVAGNGAFGFSGDGGPAPDAQLFSPFGLTVGPDGDAFVADTVNHRIRRIDAADGTITTVAGDGTQCQPAGQPRDRPSAPCGDGGSALEAQLSRPWDVAVTPAGDVLFVDNNLRRVRRVDAQTGVISTLAGTGEVGFRDGPGAQAQFDEAQGVALDAGGERLLVGDAGNNRVRAIDLEASGNPVSTLAGSGEDCGDPEAPCGDGAPATDAQLSAPTEVAVGPDGDVVIADGPTRRVRRVDAGTGVISTAVGTGESGGGGDGGPATGARLRSPRGVTVDGAGNLFVADAFDHRVRRVDAVTGIIEPWAGAGRPGTFGGDGGPAEQARLNEPWSLATQVDGALLIADRANNRVRRVAAPEPEPEPEPEEPGGEQPGGTPPPADAPPAGPPPTAPSGPPSGAPSGGAREDASPRFAAKLQVERARVRREDRELDVLAPITARASGNVEATFEAAGSTHRFREPVDAQQRRLRFREPIFAAQARLGTGILTMRYAGNARTRPQEVRLRAARNASDLEPQRPRIADGRLMAEGTIASEARGVVRLRVEWFSGGRERSLVRQIEIEDGRWELDEELGRELLDSLTSDRTGEAHSVIAFTGYLPERQRGEIHTFRVDG